MRRRGKDGHRYHARDTDAPVDEREPDWSPGGRRIVFMSEKDGNRNIYVMNADGTGLRQVTSQGGGTPTIDRDLAWSSDGIWLAWTSTVQGTYGGGMEVKCAVRPDGSDLHVIVNRDPSRSNEPAW